MTYVRTVRDLSQHVRPTPERCTVGPTSRGDITAYAEMPVLIPASDCIDDESCKTAVLRAVDAVLPLYERALHQQLVITRLINSPHAHIYERYFSRTAAEKAADDADIAHQQPLHFNRMWAGWGRGDAAPKLYTEKVGNGDLNNPSTRSYTYGQLVCVQALRRIITLHYDVEVLRMRCSNPGCIVRDTLPNGRIPSVHYRWHYPIDKDALGWQSLSLLQDAPRSHTNKKFLECLVVSRMTCAHSKTCGCSHDRTWNYQRDAHTL